MSASIKTYEAFYVLPDFSNNDISNSGATNKSLIITQDKTWAQVFKAQSEMLPSFFFMASFSDEANISQLKITIKTSNSTYAVDGNSVEVASVLCSSSMKVTGDSASFANWYRWDTTDITLTSGNYYSVIFSTTGDESPNIYFSYKYRKLIFPIVKSTSASDISVFSNANFTESSSTGVKVGAICCGFLGNEINEFNALDSGDIVLGGASSSRGYAVYLYVLKMTANEDLFLQFSKYSDSMYNTEETYKSYMTWYCFDAGTLPITNDTNLYNDAERSVQVVSPNDFVVFVQPDKFPPYSKEFFPKIEMALRSEKLNTTTLYESYSDLNNQIQADTGVIYNNTDLKDTTYDNWAVFREKKKISYRKDIDAIDPNNSVNPPYIDFSLERQDDIEQFAKISLMDIDSANGEGLQPAEGLLPIIDVNYPYAQESISDVVSIRGFTNISKIKDIYLMFGKYQTSNDFQSVNLPHAHNIFINDSPQYGYCEFPIRVGEYNEKGDFELIDYSSVGSSKSEKYVRIQGDQEVLGAYVGDAVDSRYVVNFIGVYDTKTVILPSGHEVMFILFQVLPPSIQPFSNNSYPYFVLGYLHEDNIIYSNGVITKIIIKCVGTPESLPSDAFFDSSGISTDIDLKFAQFIASPEPDVLYYTCRNASYGLGLWKIDLSKDPSSYVDVVSPPKTSSYLWGLAAVSKVLISGFRGFSASSRGIEITSVLEDSSNSSVYYGVSTANIGALSATFGAIGEVFRIKYENNSVIVEQIMSGDPDQEWLKGYTSTDVIGISSSVTTPYDVHYDIQMPNSEVPFMTLVNNILHVWVSPYTKDDGYGRGYGFDDAHGTSWYYQYGLDSSSLYSNGYDGGSFGGTPFHIGINLDDKEIKVLRRFPLSKSTTYGVLTDYASVDIQHITGGVVCDKNIYIVGMGKGGNLNDGDSWTPRWLCYDVRTINNSFRYYNNYDVKQKTTYDTVSDAPAKLKSETDLNWAEKRKGLLFPHTLDFNGSKKYGAYQAYTYAKINNNNSNIKTDYPAFCKKMFNSAYSSEESPRLGKYVDYIFKVDSSELDIFGIRGERNPRIYTQFGLPFVLCDNFEYGFHAYKTYGLMQNPKDWGYDFSGFSTTISDTINGYDADMHDCVYENGDLNFNGVSSYIEVDNHEDLRVSGDFSICVWVKLGSVPAATGMMTIFCNGISNDAKFRGILIRLYYNANEIINPYTVEFRIGNGTTAGMKIETTAGANNLGTGYHYIVCTCKTVSNTKLLTISIDGASSDAGGVKYIASAALPLFDITYYNENLIRFGCSEFSKGARTRYFNGAINDVRIYNTGISAGTISSLYALGMVPNDSGVSTSLVAHWNLNGDSNLKSDIKGLTFNSGNAIKCFGSDPAIDSARRISISNCNNLIYISGLKNNNYTSVDKVSSTSKDRYIYRCTAGTKKPQNFSFYYKFNYLREVFDKGYKTADNQHDLTFFMKNEVLNIPGNVEFSLKAADSIESLYYEPKKEIQMPLAFDCSSQSTEAAWFHYTFGTDADYLFWRLECQKLPTPYDPDYFWKADSNRAALTESQYYFGTTSESDNYNIPIFSPYNTVLIKGLSFYDVDLAYSDDVDNNKKIAINGMLMKSSNIDGKGYRFFPPQSIISRYGVIMDSEDHIIFDFPTQIYINEISFSLPDIIINNHQMGISFVVSYLPQMKQKQFGEYIVTESDWVDIRTARVEFDKNIQIDGLRIFCQSIRILLISDTFVRVNNFKIKTFGSTTLENTDFGYTKQIEYSGRVSMPNLIIVDDLKSLIVGEQPGLPWNFTSFKGNNSYVVIDIGHLIDNTGNHKYVGDSSKTLYPVNRISMNIAGGEGSTIFVGVSSTDGEIGDSVWEWVTNGKKMVNYEYCLVNWSPMSNSESNKVQVTVIDNSVVNNSSVIDPSIDPFGGESINAKLFNEGNSNYSAFFANGSLNDSVFRPNINKDTNLSILRSETGTGTVDGVLYFNAQMDGNGPFVQEIGSVGVIEKTFNVSFPVRGVRRIKIMVTDIQRDMVRINGLKIYTPLIDANTGIPDWPYNLIEWNMELRATSLVVGG